MTGESPNTAQLQTISDPWVRQLAALGRLRSYPKHTVFITEGDSSDSVFVILSGKVKVFVSDSEGHEMYGRVARLLLNLAVERDGKLTIPEKLTQQEIAERVGASRDMVSRIFRDLTAGGYIKVENRIITITKKPPARW